jgi:hypothetical protein
MLEGAVGINDIVLTKWRGEGGFGRFWNSWQTLRLWKKQKHFDKNTFDLQHFCLKMNWKKYGYPFFDLIQYNTIPKFVSGGECGERVCVGITNFFGEGKCYCSFYIKSKQYSRVQSLKGRCVRIEGDNIIIVTYIDGVILQSIRYQWISGL